MDKLISFFQPEKRKAGKIEEETEDRSDIPAEDRRKWSISRSGRMKQANRKRHSVAKDLYGEACAPKEKPTSVEYHVNSPAKLTDSAKHDFKSSTHIVGSSTPIERSSTAIERSSTPIETNSITIKRSSTPIERSSTPIEPRSPEEEIESAFEILDKIDKLEKTF